MKTELARTATGDILYHHSGCGFIAKASDVIAPISQREAIEALIAINAGQRLFQHWDLAADDVEHLCRLVDPTGSALAQ